MIRCKQKIRKYHAPQAVVTQMMLESNFCQSVLFNVQVDEIHNMNSEVEFSKRVTSEDPYYFEF